MVDDLTPSPAPAVSCEESTTTSDDGMKLHYQKWPIPECRGRVLIVPGYADHAGRYPHLCEFLNQAGLEVFVVDLRGHGKSEGVRGYVERFSLYLDDVDAMLDVISRQPGEVPCFIFGHSMGGLVTLSHALNRAGSQSYRGIAISSPFLGLAFQLSAFKFRMGRIMTKLWPKFAMPSGIDPADLTHDDAVNQAYANDPLVFKTARARWFSEAMGAIGDVRGRAASIIIPILIMQATEDKLADPTVAGPLCNRLGADDKTYIEYEGFRHEIMNEVDKNRPMTDLRDWILKRL